MKIKWILCVIFLSWLNQGIGQVYLGVKGGISAFDVNSSILTVLDADAVEDFQLSIEEAKNGLHFGFFLQARVGILFIQPEVLFNSNTIDFRLVDRQGTEPDLVKDENYQHLDLPCMIGLKFGPVRVGGGPVGHLFLNSTSDLKDLNESGTRFEQDFNRFTYGWQAGVGLDLWKLHIDLRYEGNITNFGEHMIFDGVRYSFGAPPTRILASLGLSF